MYIHIKKIATAVAIFFYITLFPKGETLNYNQTSSAPISSLTELIL